MPIAFVVLILGFVSVLRAEVAINFQQESWKEIKLNKSEPNKFEYGEKLKIIVKKTNSPVVFKFDEVQELSSLDFEASVEGEIKASENQSDFDEDSYLQFGFVVVGDNHLGAMGKLFAPKWVSEVFALAPQGQGLDKVYFYNVASRKDLVNKERQNPKSKYMYETIISTKDDLGKMVSFTLPKKLKTTALWIGAEGDQTESEFTTTVNKVILR